MIYISYGVCKYCTKQKYCIESSRGVQCKDFRNKEDKENGSKNKHARTGKC